MSMRPRLDDSSLHALLEAIEPLTCYRGLPCPLTDPGQAPDPGNALHLLQTLILQADHYLPGLIAAAYDHRYTRNDIRNLLGLSTPPPSPTHDHPTQRHPRPLSQRH